MLELETRILSLITHSLLEKYNGVTSITQMISDEDYEALQNFADQIQSRILNSTQLDHMISTSTELPETVDNAVFCNFASVKVSCAICQYFHKGVRGSWP